MASEYVQPKYKEGLFNCPRCRGFSTQLWLLPNELNGLLQVKNQDKANRGIPFDVQVNDVAISVCFQCHKSAFWEVWNTWEQFGRSKIQKEHQSLVYPSTSSIPIPNEDMPEEIKFDYIEARAIAGVSPRGAAALLRLCIQKLMPYLGESGTNLNNDIKSLVRKGLRPRVQEALDYVRVIGNEAVHPGTIDLNDNRETAYILFDQVNLIVTQTLSADRDSDSSYMRIPEEYRDHIARRDGKHPAENAK